MSASAETQVVLAIDGGNTKPDVALLAADGRLLSLVRGGTSSHQQLGFEASIEALAELVAEARASAVLETGITTATAEVARVLLAGADLEEEVERLQSRFGALGWSRRLVVENDTLALLRTGTDRGWGVAVVCGGGINAVGIAPDGREARFPALGAITGDWGGGHDAGIAALGAANRSADGRGPKSTLEHAVPQHFGMRTPLDVARAVHFQEISVDALAQLTPVVFDQAAGDAVAHEILERITAEVGVLATTVIKRLELGAHDANVVVGGGLMRAAPAWMIERITESVHASCPRATVVVATDGPVVGAAMLGLDEIGASADAISRARAELQQAIGELSTRSQLADPARQ
jgi:N-acetylglucosamine kinase-like BadF-type ATPase